jgi:hypothetical protein
MSTLDYEKLFKEAFKHLRAVSGSRNSFTREVISCLFMGSEPIKALRSPAVEKMHLEAVKFISQHQEFEES